MGTCYKHLSLTDRYKIEVLLNRGIPKKEIADEIHVHISTIYREVKRARMVQRKPNGELVDRYSPQEAHRKYRENLSAKGPALKIGDDFTFAQYMKKKIIFEHYSPAAALHAMENDGVPCNTKVCAKTVYNYIDKGVFKSLTNNDLPEKAKRKHYAHKHKEMKSPPKGESIENRPADIADRNTFGHWEMDTVYGRKEASKDVLLVLTERLTRKEIVIPMPDRTADSTLYTVNHLEIKYGERFPIVFRTITVDNGGEFANVTGLESSILDGTEKRTKLYFCHPYSSWERGSNENLNRMIRRRFPKGTDFGTVSAADVAQHEKWINHYPRKILGWKSSEQAFQEELAKLGIPTQFY